MASYTGQTSFTFLFVLSAWNASDIEEYSQLLFPHQYDAIIKISEGRTLAQLSCAPIRALEVVSCGLQAVVSPALARTLRNIFNIHLHEPQTRRLGGNGIDFRIRG